ncbi:MAG: hypothetical protein H5U40_17790 [Polyangiaceae bacterium]|nr:hypothetical protein [Polyangiaceae bacterium]
MPIERAGERPTSATIACIIDGAFFLLYALLSFEIVLRLLGASEAAPFHRFTRWATAPFFAPFEKLLYDPSAGHHRLMFSYLMGLIAYSVLHVVALGLIEAFTPRRRTHVWRHRAR